MTHLPPDTNLPPNKSTDPEDQPMMAHIAELRGRLIKILLLLLAVFLALIGFRRQLYDFISTPLTALLPAQASIIATDVASGFLAPIRLTFFVALFISVPFILGQIWGFVAPALYRQEKRIALPLLLSAITLFYLGIAFAYLFVLVPALKFLVLFAPDNVLPMTDIDSYLDFVIHLFLLFGLMFEIPVATILLILMRVVSVQSLVDKRRYIIVGCFFIAAIITPPDGGTMIMLAIPMCLLFELGLIAARLLSRTSPMKNSNEH